MKTLIWIQIGIMIIFILMSYGCATEKDIRDRNTNRYVTDGVYNNVLKGFSLDWPSKYKWEFKNYPEFDLCFNHTNGRSQIFITSVKSLIRRDFPDAFVDWILERLQVKNKNIISRNKLNSEYDEKFRIITKGQFLVLPAEQYGVDRKVAATVIREGSLWLAAVYLAPEKFFETYLSEADSIFESIEIIQD